MNARETVGLTACVALAVVLLGSQSARALVRPPRPQLMGHIDGLVVKESGAVVVGARVVLMTDSGKILGRTKSAAGGQFRFIQLASGKYWTKTTFGSLESKDRGILEPGAIIEMKIVLEE